MTDKKFNLDFYARVKTDIDSVNDVISALKNQLNSLEIPKNAGKGLEKSLGHLVDEVQNFETLAKRGVSDLSDTKKLNSSWKKITDYLTTIGSQITDLKEIGDKIFPKEVLANIEKADKALEKYTAKIESIKKSKPYTDKLEERRQAGVKSTEAKKAYERESSKYETQKTRVQNDRDAWEQNRAAEYAAQLQKIAEINTKLEEQKKIQKDLLAIQDQLREAGVVTKQGDITSSHRRELNKAKDIEGSFKEEVTKREKALQEAKEAEEKARRKVSAQKSAESRAKNNSNTSAEKTAEATQKRIEAEKAYQKAVEETAQKLRELEEARADYEKAQTNTQKLQDQASQAKNIKEQIENSEAQSEALRKQAKAAEDASEENKKIKKDLESSETALKDQKIALENSEKAFEDAKTKVKLLDEELKKMETDGATIEWSELATVIKEVTGIDVSQFSGDVQQVLQVLQDYKTGKIEDLPELFNKILNSLNGANPAIKNFGEEINKAEDETKEFNTRVNEMESLKSRIFDFFSITSAVQLFRQAVRSAINTVKELDAVMTETAVVTDFTIGDMWDKLPEYSANATKLGASIKDLYSATTLYYQQGLQTEAAMSVGIETMKMARIANLDAADATQAMTAALRGFNMEVDEVNAQRVNDVYSELAAITAADTGQIADAMTKTASIAHSANMEFETTAALLAQIIETTQEAPETAGTAMKTIIARFTEVKQLFNEGMLTGEDSEGEVVDINKIDAALRTVGISLKDFLNGSKGIDDIFLELAEKWDTLDLATQRYIATTAAGSRQQSRFIAMMSNYERTMELVTAANNSAGASQDQFDKTLDSLAAKTQKLSNAWAEFTMGLANNEILKFGVEVLTGLLTIVNKFTDFLSGNNGIAKSLITLTLAITALNGARVVLAKIFGSSLLKTVVESFDKIKAAAKDTGTQAGQSVKTGIITALKETVPEFAKTGAEGADALSRSFNKKIHLKNQPVHLGKSAINYQGKKKARVGEVGEASTAQTTPTTNLDTPTTSPQSEVKLFDKAMQSTSISALYLTGTLTTLTGVGLNAAGSFFKGREGTDAFGVGLETAGATASIAGSAISLLAPVLSTLNVSIGALILPIGIAVVAIGALAAVMHAVYKNSPAGKLEQAEKAAERAGEAANNAAESFNNLNTALDSLDNKYKNLEELTRGTKEWNAAVRETNQEVLDLIEKYPALAAFVESNNGVLTFNKDPNKTNTQGKNFNEIYASYEAAVGNSQAVKIMADMAVESAQQKVDYEDYRTSQEKAGSKVRSDTGWLKEGVYNYSKENEDGTTTVDSWNTQEVTEKVARAMAKGDVGLEAESITKFLRREFKFATDAAIVLGNALEKESLQLLEFGQSLALSDEKIEAYASMLITQARNKSGLEGQVANMAENFITSDMVERIKQERENSINDGGISEDEKEDYAIAMGYEFVEGNKFKNAAGEEINVKNEEIASGLAIARALDEVAKKMEAFADSIPALRDTKLANLYTKAEGQGLTKADFNEYEIDPNKELDKEALVNEAKNIFNDSQELQDLYGKDNINDFINFFVESMTLGAEQYKQAVEKLTSENSNFWQGGVEALFGKQENLDVGSMGAIIDQLYNVFLTSGKSASDQLGGIIKNTFNELDAENAQLFANALGTIDWTNIDSIEKLDEYLIDLGFDATAAGIDVENLEEQIKDFAKATKNINLESLKAEIKSLDELAEDLADREETERVFSDEEKKALLKANPDMANDFVMTGIDEWTYIGDSMGTLEEAVREATKTLWETYSEQTREAGEKSQKWEDLAKGDVTWQSGKTDYQILQQLATGKLEANDIGETGWNRITQLMQSMGMFAEGADISGYTSDDLIEILSGQYQQYGAVAVRTENISNAENMQNGQYATAYYSDLSGQEILNAENTYSGIEKDEDIQARKDALDAKLVTEEGLREEEMALREANAQLQEHNDLTSAAVSDAADHRKEMQKLADVINDNEDALSSAAKGTAEYQKAIDKVTVVAKEAFGDNITSDFVESNLDAFKDWANGVEGSTERIRAAIMEQVVEQDELYGSTKEVQDAIAKLDGLNFDVYGNADFSQIMNSLELSEDEMEKFVALVESLGYTITWKKTKIQDKPLLYRYDSVISDTAGRARQTNAVNNSGGSGGGGTVEYYDNTFDKLYNLVREIGEEVREMARLERKYEKLLKSDDTDAGKLYDNLVDQLNQLGRQQGLNERLRDERKAQMKEYLAENSELNKYANIFQNEDGRDVLRINWEQIDAILDPDRGQQVEDYVGQLEEWMDELDDIEEELWDIEDQIEDIHETGKQEYLDLEVALKEAVEWSYQEEIDKLSQINDSINDTNTKLINSIQKQINKIRQDRENEKREQELEEKQRRLMYLNQDTSGANAIQVLGLQEEIDNETQDYTDSLIDQKIGELQEQNEDAAAQREKQIQLLQTQLDYAIKSGEIWNEVYTLIDDGLDPTKGLVRGSVLENLLKRKEGFEGMSQLQQMEWLEELEDQAALAAVYLNDLKNVKPSYSNITNNYYQGSQIQPESPPPSDPNENNDVPTTPTPKYYKAVYYVYDAQNEKYSRQKTGATEEAARQAARADIKKFFDNGTMDQIQFSKALETIKVTPVYKKGGLADFTGPAWLDGTKSRPEMVLNARDTQNFIQLKDILSSLLSRTSSTNNASTENNGDITYDIDINVETMSSDYDIEQVANKVKSLINEEARYRNNNAVSLTR